MRHAVGLQGVQFRHAQLEGVVAKNVADGFIKLRTFPGKQILARRGLEPLRQTYNLRVHQDHCMLKLIPIPAFADNYLWMLHDGKRALVVDPGDAAPVMRVLKDQALQLESILVTHHHADHIGGVDALRDATGARVYGPASERIPAPYEPLSEGDAVHAMGLDFQVIDVPGHTAGHIAYYCAAPTPVTSFSASSPDKPEMSDKPLLFCGDTLFSAGCGRLFEGTPAQMLLRSTSSPHCLRKRACAAPTNTPEQFALCAGS